jgi:hypothetical protein
MRVMRKNPVDIVELRLSEIAIRIAAMIQAFFTEISLFADIVYDINCA